MKKNILVDPDALELAPIGVAPGLRVSVVIPFLNEKDTLEPLTDKISQVLDGIGESHEIILVDDGSTDGSSDAALALAQTKPAVRLISFTRNFGKAAALSAGMAAAQGAVIITMDADLQDDPDELPRFLERIAEGYDVVTGWKKTRHDPIGKTLPSKVFNQMSSWLFDIKLHDINCGFKAYTRRSVGHLNLYGELHRFTPAILHAAGFKVVEIDVLHHARAFGQSKYGIERFIKGILDMITVKLVTRYSARPLHFFAMLGVPIFLLGSAMISYLTVLWFIGLGPIGNRPLLLIGILLVITGTQLVGVGLLAELFQAGNLKEHKKYVIHDAIGFGADDE